MSEIDFKLILTHLDPESVEDARGHRIRESLSNARELARGLVSGDIRADDLDKEVVSAIITALATGRDEV